MVDMEPEPNMPDIVIGVTAEAASRRRFLSETEAQGFVYLKLEPPPQVWTVGGRREFPTEESMLAWAALRARDLVREEGRPVKTGNAVLTAKAYGRQEDTAVLFEEGDFADSRNYPPRKPQTLQW